MTHLGSPLDYYDLIEQIGDGSFGTVHKAKHKTTKKLVALKQMKKKYTTLEECQGQFEPKLIKLLPPSCSIVSVYDSFLEPTSCELSFILEYMDGGNLYQLMHERRHSNKPFTHYELKKILQQILSGVSHIHSHNVFHRDMKPENLLVDYSTGKPLIKLADFGLAREIKNVPPFTEYVSTRWYRAPEVLLRSTEYSYPVDLWAIGAIFAEMITLDPLFPGESEIDQIYRICEILGSPGNKLGIGSKIKNARNARPEKRLSPGFAKKKSASLGSKINAIDSFQSTISPLDGGGEWKEGVKLAYKIGFKFPQFSPKPLETVIPNATESMLDLIRHFLFFNPSQRWTADRALHHRFFVEETQEPIHTVIETLPPFNHNQPVTPPIQPRIFAIRKEFTPFDLLETPTVPYQICPDWNTDQPSPVSSKDGNRRVASSHHPHHKDLFLNDVEAVDNNAWISKSRPIYSSHQKIHPGLDRPNSSTNSKIWSSELKRLATPTSDNGNAPSYTSNHESEGHHNEGAVCTLSISKSLDHISQYGNQVIKWSPPSPVYHSSTPMIRPESRRSRSSTRLLYSVSKDPHQPSVETSASSPSIFQDNKHWLTNNRRKTQKTMDNNGEIKKYQVAGRHRFNIWIPENDEDENDDQDDNDDDDEYQRPRKDPLWLAVL